MKKVAAVFLTCAMLLIFAASCFNKTSTIDIESGDEKQTGEKVRLRFMSSWGGVDSKAETLQKVCDKFMKDNPDIEVVNESLFGEDFLPKLKTDFASGNDPDVFGLWPGSDIRALVRAGKVAELTSEMNWDRQWKNSFGKSMWDYTTFDGKIYGLPVEIIFECLFINRDLFQKYSVKVPENYDELKEAVVAFKKHGIIPIAYNSLAEGTFLYQNLVAMLGGREDTEKPFDGDKVKSCYIQAMKYMQELYKLGAFPPNAFTLSNNERNSLFREKKAAMIVQGSWFIGDFRKDTGSVEIIPFPMIKEGASPYTTIIYGLGCGTFHMSSATWNSGRKEAAMKLLKCLTSKESAASFAAQTGMLSNVDISEYNITYNRLTQKGKEFLYNAGSLIGPPDSFVDRTVWENIIVKDFPYVLEGKKEPEALWQEAIARGANLTGVER